MAAKLETLIYPLAEHTLQMGMWEIYPALQDEEFKKRLQDYLANEHLLVPVLNKDNNSDRAAVAKVRRQQKDRIQAALELVHTLELGGVPPNRIRTVLNEVFADLEAEARERRALTVGAGQS